MQPLLPLEKQSSEPLQSPRPYKKLFRDQSQSPLRKNSSILIIESIRELESAQKKSENNIPCSHMVIKPQDPSFFDEIVEKGIEIPEAEKITLNLANIQVESNAEIITKFTKQLLGNGKINLFELKGVNSHEFAQSLVEILRSASSLTSFSIFQQENLKMDSTQEELELSLIKSLVANPNLECLEFNEISSSKALDTLVKNLKDMLKLTSLKISFRLENPDVLNALFETLQEKKTLRNISLHFNNEMIIDNNNLSYLSNMIKGLEELQSIELTFKNANEGDSEGMQNLMKIIATKSELISLALNVENCKGFDSECLDQITMGVSGMKKLANIEFSCMRTRVSVDALCKFTQTILDMLQGQFLHLNLHIDVNLLSHKGPNAVTLKNNVIKLQNANATIVID